MLAITAAALLAGGSPPEIARPAEICDYAIQKSLGETAPLEVSYERFVGRLEIRMSELNLSEEQKKVTRFVCDAFNAGIAKGISYSLEVMRRGEKEPSTVAVRP